MQDTKGYNPYKFGVRGRLGLAQHRVPYRQDNFYGGAREPGRHDRAAHGRRHCSPVWTRASRAPPELTGVWAEENTRASIFDGMQRKETFAASGPHIKVRLFGGWDYTADMLDDRDWVKTWLREGVPMGGDLPPAGPRRRPSWCGP